MKARLLLVLVFAVSQVFLTGGVTAQGSAPPLTTQPNMSVLADQAGVPDVNAQAIVQGWQQSNVSGFGAPQNESILALGVYDSQMYAAAGTFTGGGQVWRTPDGKTWTATNSLGDSSVYPNAFAVFTNTLYLGAGSNATGAAVYTSTNGLSWTNVITGGFGTVSNTEVINMAVFNSQLYAATIDANGTIGGQIWRTSNGISWTNVVTDNFGLGASNPNAWWSFETFDGQLYAGTGSYAGGGVLYRTNDGAIWTPVTTSGFGDANVTAIPCLAAFNGYLYACARTSGASGVGAQVWRSSTGDPGSWTQVASDGLGDSDYNRPYGLIVADNVLYLTLTVRGSLEGSKGDVIWRTTDGVNWVQDVSNGWGDPKNAYSDYSDKGAAVFNGSLYVGTTNSVAGGQVWQRLHPVYLPLILK